MRSSAAGSTFSEYYGVNGNIGRAIMIIASLATVLLGLNKLVQIIGYISPVLLVTIIIGVISIASNPEGIAQADASLQTITVHTNFSNWVISGLMYGAYTVTGVVPYLADIGKSTSTNKKNSVWGGVFGGGAFILAVMMVTFIDKMQENVADTEAEIVEWYREKAESAGVTLTQDEVMDEITADFAGDMMENPDLFREFSHSNRTAAQKLLDSLKEFIAKVKSIFTGKARDVAAQEAYGKDFAELEAVAQKWQLAFDAAEQQAERAKTAAGEGDGVRFSLKQTRDGRNYVMVENAMTNAELKNHQAVANYIAQHIGEVYTIIESGQRVYIGDDLPAEYTRSRYTQSIIKSQKSKAKNKAVSNLGEMIEIATNRRWEQTKHAHNKDAAYGMYRYDTTFAFPVQGTQQAYKAYDAELVIRNASDGKKYLYDIVAIKKHRPCARP